MYLVFIKFVDVFARAAFVVGVSYLLPLRDAGQFGLIVTIIGLWAFAGNFDRHHDIQRRWVGQPPEIFDKVVLSAIPFWSFNQAVLLPFFMLAMLLLAEATPAMIGLAMLALVGEHISTWAYQMAMVDDRYRPLVITATAKNAAVALVVLVPMALVSGSLDLPRILIIWALAQFGSTLVIVAQWLRMRQSTSLDRPFRFRTHIFAQHRDSGTHFLIGLVAILTLQYDRLAVGTLLPLETVGIYFRHILIVSFVYQFFTIASLNRVTPRIFLTSRTMSTGAMLAMLRREYALIVVVVAAAFGFALAIDEFSGWTISARFSLSAPLAAILVVGALLRIAAEFGGVICNARLHEGQVLRAQIIAFSLGAIAMVTLTWIFGLFGTGASSVVAASAYLILVAQSVFRLPAMPPLMPQPAEGPTPPLAPPTRSD